MAEVTTPTWIPVPCDTCGETIERHGQAVAEHTPPDLTRPSSFHHFWCAAGEPRPGSVAHLAKALTGLLEGYACTGDEPEVVEAREALVAAGYPDPLDFGEALDA